MTGLPLSDTWAMRDLPVLAAAATRLEGRPGAIFRATELAGADLCKDDCLRAASALLSGGYIEASPRRSHQGPYEVMISGLSDRGRRAVGLWPSESNAFEALIAAIRDAESAATDPKQKSRLRRFLDGAVGLGTEFGTQAAVVASPRVVYGRPGPIRP